eukprot:791285-Prymnesium_polylepis.1
MTYVLTAHGRRRRWQWRLRWQRRLCRPPISRIRAAWSAVVAVGPYITFVTVKLCPWPAIVTGAVPRQKAPQARVLTHARGVRALETDCQEEETAASCRTSILARWHGASRRES